MHRCGLVWLIPINTWDLIYWNQVTHPCDSLLPCLIRMLRRSPQGSKTWFKNQHDGLWKTPAEVKIYVVMVNAVWPWTITQVKGRCTAPFYQTHSFPDGKEYLSAQGKNLWTYNHVVLLLVECLFKRCQTRAGAALWLSRKGTLMDSFICLVLSSRLRLMLEWGLWNRTGLC